MSAKKTKRSGLIGLVAGVAMITPKIIEFTTGYVFQPNIDPNLVQWSTLATYFSVGPFLIGSGLYNMGRNELKKAQE